MVLNAIAGKDLPVYGDGLNVRDWLFVEDHCAALIAVLRGGAWARSTISAVAASAPTCGWWRPSAPCWRKNCRPHATPPCALAALADIRSCACSCPIARDMIAAMRPISARSAASWGGGHNAVSKMASGAPCAGTCPTQIGAPRSRRDALSEILLHGAVGGLHRRPGPICRQFQRRHGVELAMPIGQIFLQRRAGQLFPLPRGEVRVLHGQRRVRLSSARSRRTPRPAPQRAPPVDQPSVMMWCITRISA